MNNTQDALRVARSEIERMLEEEENLSPRREEDYEQSRDFRSGLRSGLRKAISALSAAPASEQQPTQEGWTVTHNGKSVTADTWSGCMASARKLRTPEEEAFAASNLAAAIAADAAEEEAERAAIPVIAKPAITDEEMQALKRFYECCEDSDSGGHDVPKTMIKRLAVIGLIGNIGFGRYATTLFGDALLAQQAADSSAGPTWQRITKPGQVKVSDKLRFTIGDDHYSEIVKLILDVGSDREEIIYNKRNNYYLITSMAIENKGSHKNVEFLSQPEGGEK